MSIFSSWVSVVRSACLFVFSLFFFQFGYVFGAQQVDLTTLNGYLGGKETFSMPTDSAQYSSIASSGDLSSAITADGPSVILRVYELFKDKTDLQSFALLGNQDAVKYVFLRAFLFKKAFEEAAKMTDSAQEMVDGMNKIVVKFTNELLGKSGRFVWMKAYVDSAGGTWEEKLFGRKYLPGRDIKVLEDNLIRFMVDEKGIFDKGTFDM